MDASTALRPKTGNRQMEERQSDPSILPEPTETTFPVKPGDWVADRNDPGRVAKVRSVHRFGSEVVVDLVLFARSGIRIGRESPALGGPKTFEPACSYEFWRRIEEPSFPIRLMWVPQKDGSYRSMYTHDGRNLEDRKWAGPSKKRAPMGKNLDLDAETAALRRAAQELRDATRNPDVAEMRKRAEVLEEQAAALSRPMR